MILKLKPLAFEKVWGGQRLKRQYRIDLENVGEIWGICFHKSNSNTVYNGHYKGKKLRELFIKHKHLFGNYPKEEFPILLKLIDANEDLSIQVHPDDKYAQINENSYGKEESWYILETGKKSSIQIGHNAKSLREIKETILNDSIKKILNYYEIKKGDYFHIPAGKVHAICKNTTLLEVSQSSDITYRIFDYNRVYKNKHRKLHLKKAFDVIHIPDTTNFSHQKNNLFSFEVLEFKNDIRVSHLYGDYIYVIDGFGYFNNVEISKGEFVIVTSRYKFSIKGDLKIALVNIMK